jgi:NAD(P)-dependent dehydrogenase (short-subunit alcohol dehydrogenase family)
MMLGGAADSGSAYPRSLADKRIVVAGGATGIGLAPAQLAAQRGAWVVPTASS